MGSGSVNFPHFSINGTGIINAITNTDILEKIQLAEDIQEKVKAIFSDIIDGCVDKLVIFIDELDRCRPNYALEMLERIKHYFDDDRIIFVISLNKEQLTHTITNYYGSGFDATRYLNKFFDLEMYLPVVDTVDNQINTYNEKQYWLNTIANALIKLYELSLRDSLIYKQKIESFADDLNIADYSDWTRYKVLSMSLFVPMIIILHMIVSY